MHTYQSSYQTAVVNPTYQYSHSEDIVAGDDPMPGAIYMNTDFDEEQGHSISSFIRQVSTLPAGNYKVEDGEIILH